MEHHVNSCELTGVADLQSATWAKKNSKSYFGYKLHSKMDTEHGLIRDIETTTASVHDSQIDLSEEGESGISR
ncbi:hypothetical protein FHEFKHOI_00800 [Candidatus Methanoperedenaceae archaeon GB50]|nr:hypothetical protein AIOGIFDO_00799 [Candidatus Methanoperedenaceae archaeon GB37]CAD7770417.1 hypothetical protein FHEFKHOI_00800 [Candidatus Methanoperedenaceae archaeon GB50]CAD7772183.1 MAG: hypothetical protein KBONHNOK_00504 [Candidatus Methanoperedenaceae archaeon GB50]